jgi:ArsR family transcriptional regulator, arsenate/arsenite/antimonite-responsive transcriptional repressor
MIDQTLLKQIESQEFGDPEVLCEKDAQLAQQLLNNHPVKVKEDAFLVMAAANLINAYVKQVKDPHDEFSYDFKRRVSQLSEDWIKTALQGVKVSHFKEVTYIDIEPLQFSFHHLQNEPSLTQSIIEDPWVKLRLQPYAKRILLSAILNYNICDETMALQLKALSDITRLQIYNQAKTNEVCACDLIKKYNLTQPTLSFHMKQLVSCGLLYPRKDGKWVKYRLNHFAHLKLKQQLGD